LNQRLDGKHRSRKACVEPPAGGFAGEEPLAQCQAELDRLAAEVARLTDENARLAEENRAFVTSVRHMTRAAEEVLIDARREAAETRARAAAEAYERLIVARADARAAVHEERSRTAAELELLAAVRERLQAERSTLSLFQDELSGRLRDLVSAVFDFEDRTPSLTAGPSWEGQSTTDSPEVEQLGPQTRAASHVGDVDHTAPAADSGASFAEAPPAFAVAPVERYVDTVVVEDREPAAEAVHPADDAEEELEAAFAAFFHADIEGEPSRHWILDGR
jgi:hypothetical protein